MSQYWNCDCCGCGTRLRIRASESDFGRLAKLDCLRCGKQTETVIGSGSPLVIENEKFDSEEIALEMKELIEMIREHPKTLDIQKRLLGKGYSIEGLIITLHKFMKSKPIPKVQDGKVDPNLFIEDDETFLKQFKIKL